MTTFVILDRPVQAEGIRKDDTCLSRWQGRENEQVQVLSGWWGLSGWWSVLQASTRQPARAQVIQSLYPGVNTGSLEQRRRALSAVAGRTTFVVLRDRQQMRCVST